MEDLERILREHPFLDGLEVPHVQFIVGCAENVRFDPGQLIIKEGERADRVYLLREGRVSLEIHVPGQGPTRVESLRDGDILGFSWLYAPYHWHADGRALDRVRAISLDAECLRNKMETDQVFGYQLAKRLILHLNQRLERVRMQRLDLYKTGDLS